MRKPNQPPIGEIAQRTGLSVSAIRFYEERGLVHAGRNKGGQRRFARSDIRRLSFVMIAQQMGFSIERIAEALDRKVPVLPVHGVGTFFVPVLSSGGERIRCTHNGAFQRQSSLTISRTNTFDH